jgi:hypothetical protein
MPTNTTLMLFLDYDASLILSRCLCQIPKRKPYIVKMSMSDSLEKALYCQDVYVRFLRESHILSRCLCQIPKRKPYIVKMSMSDS